MSIGRSSLPTAGVLLLGIAVLVCLSAGAAGGHEMEWTTTALVCCFILAVAAAVCVIRRSRTLAPVAATQVSRMALRWRPVPAVRPPDPISLGALLI